LVRLALFTRYFGLNTVLLEEFLFTLIVWFRICSHCVVIGSFVHHHFLYVDGLKNKKKILNNYRYC